jgi:hypothetical protein
MAVKVLMTWDIAAERDQEYFEFIIGEFIPGMQRLGLQPAEAWATIYGSYPQIQVGSARRRHRRSAAHHRLSRLGDLAR